MVIAAGRTAGILITMDPDDCFRYITLDERTQDERTLCAEVKLDLMTLVMDGLRIRSERVPEKTLLDERA